MFETKQHNTTIQTSSEAQFVALGKVLPSNIAPVKLFDK